MTTLLASRFQSNRRYQRRHFQRQRGAVLIAALVCLLIVMTMLGQMLLAVVQSGRQMRIERDRRQCDLLLQAGIERAAYRLSQDEAYTGETWKLPAAELLKHGDAQVSIEVATDENNGPKRLQVTAEYPTGSERSVRRSHTLTLNTASTLNTESPSSAEN